MYLAKSREVIDEILIPTSPPSGVNWAVRKATKARINTGINILLPILSAYYN